MYFLKNNEVREIAYWGNPKIKRRCWHLLLLYYRSLQHLLKNSIILDTKEKYCYSSNGMQPHAGLIWIVVNKTEHGISPQQHNFWKNWVTAAESNNMMDWGSKTRVHGGGGHLQTNHTKVEETNCSPNTGSQLLFFSAASSYILFTKKPWIRNIGWQESQQKKRAIDGLSWSQNTIYRRSLGSWTMLSRGACWISQD